MKIVYSIVLVAVLCVVATPLQATWGWLQRFERVFIDNFHTVEKDACYRSKQLDSQKLSAYIKQYKIKSIINLRSASENKQPWHDLEVAAVRELGVTYIEVPFTETDLPPAPALLALLDAFDKAKKQGPVLMHCCRGADRVGLAAALWKYYMMGKSKRVALRQLSSYYGHYPMLYGKGMGTMLTLLPSNLNDDREALRQWLSHKYPQIYPRFA